MPPWPAFYLNAEVYTGTPQWEKCIEQCNEIIDQGSLRTGEQFQNQFPDQ